MDVKLIRIYRGPSLYTLGPALLWTLEGDPATADAWTKAGWSAFRAEYPLAEVPKQPANADPMLGPMLLMAVWTRELQNAANGLIDEAGAGMRAEGQAVGWCGFHDERVARLALGIVSMLMARSAGEQIDAAALASAKRHFRAEASAKHPSPTSRAVAMGARSRGLPWAHSLFHPALWHYGWGRAGRLYLETSSNGDGSIGQRIARNKKVGCRFVRSLGFPAAEHTTADTADEAVAAAERMTGPVVIKPADRGKGHGVVVGIESEGDIRDAFAEAREWSEQPILVERFIPGDDHRLLVVDGTLVAVARREQPRITGDGRRSVRQLIDAFNTARTASPLGAQYLHDVVVDAVLHDELRRQGADMDTVPAAGVTVRLRGNANVSTGGTPINVTGMEHPEVRAMAEAIARNAGVEAVGVDYITTDITRSWRDAPGAVTEINLTPGLDVHIISGIGEAEIGAAVLSRDLGRIPLVVVIASNQDQRLLIDSVRPAFEAKPNWRCGILGDGEITIGGTWLSPVGDSSHDHVQQVLQNRDCDAALLCVTPGSVSSAGFPVDRCQLTVLGAGLRRAEFVRKLAKRCSARVIEAADGAVWPGTGMAAALMSVLAAPK